MGTSWPHWPAVHRTQRSRWQYVLSAETVKWYVKQLYGKLGVHNRDEAISRARGRGLVAAAATPAEREQALPCPLINPLPQDISQRYVGNEEKLAQLRDLLAHGARLISIYGRAGAGENRGSRARRSTTYDSRAKAPLLPASSA